MGAPFDVKRARSTSDGSLRWQRRGKPRQHSYDPILLSSTLRYQENHSELWRNAPIVNAGCVASGCTHCALSALQRLPHFLVVLVRCPQRRHLAPRAPREQQHCDKRQHQERHHESGQRVLTDVERALHGELNNTNEKHRLRERGGRERERETGGDDSRRNIKHEKQQWLQGWSAIANQLERQRRLT